jgi:hypothetical protein
MPEPEPEPEPGVPGIAVPAPWPVPVNVVAVLGAAEVVKAKPVSAVRMPLENVII